MSKENILNVGKRTIELEIKELKRLLERIDNDSFVKAVDCIYNLKGKLVICGIGKSAHIGRKIVATMNSTGTSAQFLHASEAIHGDLGLLDYNDIVICISNSGSSSEIIEIIPLLKKYSSKLIAMTGNVESFLAKNADICLNTNVEKEADVNNLAPTTSTIVQLALGDALAMALLEMRNFKSIDFAKFHPGGALGKRLLMKVADLVSEENKPQVSVDSSFEQVISSVNYSKHGITVVLEKDRIVGVITDGDIRRLFLKKEVDYTKLKAKDMMSLNPKIIQNDSLAAEALNFLKKEHIGQLVVLKGDIYVGIIDIHTILDKGVV